MIKKEVILKPMNSFGSCKAIIDDSHVSIRSYGVAGCLKAWLTGQGDAQEIGNLVNGAINKDIDTTSHSGILITQSGRQIFYGEYSEDTKDSSPLALSPQKEEFPKAASEEPPTDASPLPFDDGFSWREITTKSYPSDSLTVRYILSHRSFYNAFMLHGRYFYGEKDGKIAIAIECDLKNEPHPLPHLTAYAVFRQGYMIIAADIKSKNFYIYEY